MNSFGVSEALIIGGVLMVNAGRVTEGFIGIAIGSLTGFVRYTTNLGLSKEQ